MEISNINMNLIIEFSVIVLATYKNLDDISRITSF